MDSVKFQERHVGAGNYPYIIAEIGANHNGDMNLCRKMIDSAVECGADCVKFQSWSKGSLISKAEFDRNTGYADRHRHFGSLEDMVERYQFTESQHHEVLAYCKEHGIHFASSAFSRVEVDLLDSLDVPFIKVASMDITHLPLLRYMAGTGRPIVLSTGMATLGEIDRALETLVSAGAGPIALLHCISIYPPEYSDINLLNIPMLKQAFDLPVGFSDHSMGTAIPLAAIALGACIVEKHFTIDTELEGWDHWISATPDQLSVLVKEGRNITTALGGYKRVVSEAEMAKRGKFRRRVVLARALEAGHVLTMDDLDYKRPGNGIPPEHAEHLVGRILRVALPADHELELTDLV